VLDDHLTYSKQTPTLIRYSPNLVGHWDLFLRNLYGYPSSEYFTSDSNIVLGDKQGYPIVEPL